MWPSRPPVLPLPPEVLICDCLRVVSRAWTAAASQVVPNPLAQTLGVRAGRVVDGHDPRRIEGDNLKDGTVDVVGGLVLTGEHINGLEVAHRVELVPEDKHVPIAREDEHCSGASHPRSLPKSARVVHRLSCLEPWPSPASGCTAWKGGGEESLRPSSGRGPGVASPSRR